MEDANTPEFEIFHWKGQPRYRCSRTWEGGKRCEFDTHDMDTLRKHLMQPHDAKGGARSTTVTRPVNPAFRDLGAEPVTGFEDVRFRREED